MGFDVGERCCRQFTGETQWAREHPRATQVINTLADIEWNTYVSPEWKAKKWWDWLIVLLVLWSAAFIPLQICFIDLVRICKRSVARAFTFCVESPPCRSKAFGAGTRILSPRFMYAASSQT